MADILKREANNLTSDKNTLRFEANNILDSKNNIIASFEANNINILGGMGIDAKYKIYSDDRTRVVDLSTSDVTCEFSHSAGDDISDYVSYDEESLEFTILKPFKGYIIAEVVEARSSGSSPFIDVNVNGSLKIEINARSNQLNGRGSAGFVNDLVEGDKIQVISPQDKGYPLASIMFIVCSDEDEKMFDIFGKLSNGFLVE